MSDLRIHVTIPFPLRSVELRLPGIGRDGYMLFAVHPDGFRGTWLGQTGSAGRSIEIVLPPGANELRLEFSTNSGKKFHRPACSVVVERKPHQVLTWDLRSTDE